MRHTRGRVVEVDSLDELERRLARGATSLNGWRLRSLDLTGYADVLAGLDVTGATFLGCTLPPV
ncbi:MAG TPA: Rossmann fold nucleotide-binding protein, partial [Actinomycetes bacterium]|nr:Rossmann fold nucleotide-binding protein [Actinomycetes bacterium]